MEPAVVRIEPTEVLNSIGCGDTLSASLTLELQKCNSLQHAAIVATNLATMQGKTIHPGSFV
jgi:fructose-1-phosphate kinase PfkB-like protein